MSLIAAEQILKLVGPAELAGAALSCGKTLVQHPLQNPAFARQHAVEGQKTLQQRIEGLSGTVWNDLALDLVSKMLQPDPTKRITAAEAASHEFFHQPSAGRASAVTAQRLTRATRAPAGAIDMPVTADARFVIRDNLHERPPLQHVSPNPDYTHI